MTASRPHRGLAIAFVLLIPAGAADAQSPRLAAYLGTGVLAMDAQAQAAAAPASRDRAQVMSVLPLTHPDAFAAFAASTGGLREMLRSIEAARLNKTVASAPGANGTSLVSRVAAPAVVGAAVEYGSILEQTTGTTTTLRGNLLGISRLLLGADQFPYCPFLNGVRCSPAVRRLRSLSGAVTFESVSGNAPSTAPAAPDLLGDNYRVSAWSVRLDLTPSNNLDDPKYLAAWTTAIAKLRADPASAALTSAVADLFSDSVDQYAGWMAETTAQLLGAPDADAFYLTLENRLDVLLDAMRDQSPQFATNVAALDRAYQNYYDVRDALLRDAQVHKASLEFVRTHVRDHPSTSALRFVYSDQPSTAPAIVTANAAATWYDPTPEGVSSALRDIQLAVQIDRRLGGIPQLGNAVLTFAAYYQWMKDDAVISIPAGSLAPGTAIELPGEASQLLGTKGHIAVAQGKLAIPLGTVVKMPISVTWSSRRELVKEREVRGQIGMTIDLDTLFH